MAGGFAARFKFPSVGHKKTPSTIPSPTAATSPAPTITVPKEYLCPISGHIMSDPVIIPTGQTFERVCIKACIDLGVEPPPPPLPFPPSSAPTILSPSTYLVPNLTLRSLIQSWCSSNAHPLPSAPDLPTALLYVRCLCTPYSNGAPPEPNSGGTHTTTHSFPSSPSTTSTSNNTNPPSGEVITHEESNPPGSDPHPISTLEGRILAKLKSTEQTEQQEGLVLLRTETRDNTDLRGTLCTSAILAALRPFLLSRVPTFQSNAAACLVNLSLENNNKTPIVRSGAVPPLVSAIRSSDMETRSNAAAAIFSLSVDDENKAALGALGALQALVWLVSRVEDQQTTRDGLLALYHLSLNCTTNRGKLAKLESAGALVRTVAAGGPLAHVALMVMGNLSGCTEGRGALMDAGAMEAVVAALRGLLMGPGKASASKVEQCVAVIYRMSKATLRFRGVARAMEAEELLEKVADEDGGEAWERVREMAMRALGVLRGEGCSGGEGGHSILDGDSGGGDSGNLASSVASFPRWKGGGRPVLHGGGGVNSTEF